MKPKSEELLYLLMWTCDCLFHPTLRNLTDSFEGWAYRNGFLRQVQRLEKNQLLEQQPDKNGNRLYRLTHAGRLHALGGRDPEVCWKRRWDQHWYLVLFDVPESEGQIRDKLRWYLKNRGFGYLQHSVWITPDPLGDEKKILMGGTIDVGSLILLEARPCAGESNAELVAGAWDFVEINGLYERHQVILDRRPHGTLESESSVNAFSDWLRDERDAWQAAMRCDPLLPGVLLPPNYRGCPAWRARLEAMREAAQQMRDFKPPRK